MRRIVSIAVVVVVSGTLHAAVELPLEIIVVATDAGQVAVLDKANPKQPILEFRPSRVAGRVHLVVGDWNGDGRDDLGVADPVGGVHQFITDGTLQRSFTPFPGFSGGVTVAAGDVNGDGQVDIITGAGAGAPGGHVRVFDGASGAQLASFFAFDPNFTGGVFVGAADFDADGHADVIVGAGPGGGPHVKVFNGRTFSEHASFLPFDPTFTGGVFVAGATAEMAVTAGSPPGGFAAVRVFRAGGETQWLMPFPSYKGGMTIAQSQGLMGKAPTRSQIPGGYDVETTW